MAALKQSYNLFNKHKIQFSADGNQVTLNDCSVNLESFSMLPYKQKVQCLIHLPTMPETALPSATNVFTLNPRLIYLLVKKNAVLISTKADVKQFASELLSMFRYEIQEKIIYILSNIIDELCVKYSGIFGFLKDTNSKVESVIQILEKLKDFFKSDMDKNYMEYEIQKENARKNKYMSLNLINNILST